MKRAGEWRLTRRTARWAANGERRGEHWIANPIRRAVRHSLSHSMSPDILWEASRDIEKQGSLFNVRRAVLHSLRRFLFCIYIVSNVLYSRFAIQCSRCRSPFAAPFASSFAAQFAIRRAIRRAIRLVIRCAVRHSPRRFLFIFPNFRYSNFAISH